VKSLRHFDGARDLPGPGDRVREVVKRAQGLREQLLDAPPVVAYRSLDLFCGPYPTTYGLRDAHRRIGPYLFLSNRIFAVQFLDFEGVQRTLLWNATHWGDGIGLLATPYFRRMQEGFGAASALIEPLITRPTRTVPQAIAELGLTPDQIDFLAYDHMHVQDVRPWMTTDGLLPRATLLITRAEWQITRCPSQPQRDWFCPGGTDGVTEDRVRFLDTDVALGPAVSIVRTPGHTAGNQSLVVRTDEGLMVTSENGVGPECFEPKHSGLSGLARYSRDTGMDIVLNGNTLEGAIDQYISMSLEKALAGPSQRDPRFPNIVSSSELTGHWAYPGARPSFAFGELSFGAFAPARP
jgi:hypothetical protein